MIQPAIPENENSRLEALYSYLIVDSEIEEEYNDITELATQMLGVPISLISFIDKDLQWFKSTKGIEGKNADRRITFCSHAINEPDKVMVVEDARKDKRFFDNPLVVEDPNVTFYAAAPLVTKDGYALGTICVIDNKPKDFDQ